MKTMWLMCVAIVACASNETATVPTTITSAGVIVDVDPASDQITADRCSRQLACGNIGKDRTWSDRNACTVDVNAKTHTLLGRSCVSIDPTRLSACLAEIRDQRCEQVNEVPVSCEGVRLCR